MTSRLTSRVGGWLPAAVVFVAVIGIWEISLLALQVQAFLLPRPSVIWSKLAALRDLKNKVFDASLTEKAKELFR